MSNLLSFEPKTTEFLTPSEYVLKYQKGLRNVQSIRIIPPKIGEEGFGKIKVVYSQPVYELPTPKKQKQNN